MDQMHQYRCRDNKIKVAHKLRLQLLGMVRMYWIWLPTVLLRPPVASYRVGITLAATSGFPLPSNLPFTPCMKLWASQL